VEGVLLFQVDRHCRVMSVPFALCFSNAELN
jgi:hypothetical protein